MSCTDVVCSLGPYWFGCPDVSDPSWPHDFERTKIAPKVRKLTDSPNESRPERWKIKIMEWKHVFVGKQKLWFATCLPAGRLVTFQTAMFTIIFGARPCSAVACRLDMMDMSAVGGFEWLQPLGSIFGRDLMFNACATHEKTVAFPVSPLKRFCSTCLHLSIPLPGLRLTNNSPWRQSSSSHFWCLSFLFEVMMIDLCLDPCAT